MPKIGQGIDKMEELEKEQYGWTKLAEDKILSDNNFKLIAAPQILKPWKLILKKKFFK